MGITVEDSTLLVNQFGHEVIILFSCSTQMSMKFQLLLKIKVRKNKYFSLLNTVMGCIYLAYKC